MRKVIFGLFLLVASLAVFSVACGGSQDVSKTDNLQTVMDSIYIVREAVYEVDADETDSLFAKNYKYSHAIALGDYLVVVDSAVFNNNWFRGVWGLTKYDRYIKERSRLDDESWRSFYTGKNVLTFTLVDDMGDKSSPKWIQLDNPPWLAELFHTQGLQVTSLTTENIGDSSQIERLDTVYAVWATEPSWQYIKRIGEPENRSVTAILETKVARTRIRTVLTEDGMTQRFYIADKVPPGSFIFTEQDGEMKFIGFTVRNATNAAEELQGLTPVFTVEHLIKQIQRELGGGVLPR